MTSGTLWGLLRCGMRGVGGETVRVRIVRRAHVPVALASAFAGFRFPPEVIVLAVRGYLRFGVSYRDVDGTSYRRSTSRADHRCVGVRAAGRRGRSPVLQESNRIDQGDAGRGCHRPGGGVPEGARRTGARGLAPHRTVRQQPHGSRPWPAEAAAAPDARTQTDFGARVVIAGHAFVQDLRRGHYELAVNQPATLRLAVAFDELVLAM